MHSIQSSYMLLTTMRNEKEMLTGLFDCVLCQTLQPVSWVIVDDGSTDNSYDSAIELAEGRRWITVIRKDQDSTRSVCKIGAALSFGFKKGLGISSSSGTHPEMTGILDADTVVDTRYFERLSNVLAETPRAAIATGLISTVGGLATESKPIPRGCARLYVVSFLEEIGGVPIAPAYETIIEIKARNRGFTLVIDPQSTGTHRRASSSSKDTTGYRNLGYSHYLVGTDFTSFLLVSISLLFRYGALGAVAFAKGYFGARRQKQPRIDDPEIRKYFSSSLRRLVASKETRMVIKSLLRGSD